VERDRPGQGIRLQRIDHFRSALSKIAGALLNAPVVPGVDILLEPEGGGLVEAPQNGHEHPGLLI
jgi:hypothetical protein